MSNPLHPDHMSADERFVEIVTILAAGVIRIYAPKSSDEVAETREILLDLTANQSGSVPKQGEPEIPK